MRHDRMASVIDGLGLVFRAQVTRRGIDILARLLRRRFGLPLGHGMLLDGAAFAVAP